jgi:isoleucyl-tRNA synthetase
MSRSYSPNHTQEVKTMAQHKSTYRFEQVGSTFDHVRMESQITQVWRDLDIIRRCVTEREAGPEFVFFEGPPTANGEPGIHHVLARAVKDMFIRYKTMQGYHVLRKAGWDTHGLPVEIEVERQLGLRDKKAVEDYGVAAFNAKCRASVLAYVQEWEALTERMAYWVDLEHPYATMDNGYVESLWWILKQLWDRGLLFQAHDVVPYCPRCGTPLSSHELSQGYQEGTVDPSVYVQFAVCGEEGAYLLAWTTTPWTLPGNVALAVGEDVEYVKARDAGGDTLYLAAALAEAVLRPGYEVLQRLRGRDLVDMRYEPLYRFLPVQEDYAYVVAADFVSVDEGTGIVHIAPAFGADDMRLGRAYGLPVVQTVNATGEFVPEVTPWAGQFVKDADPSIQADLERRGLLYRAGTYEHTYPFCWRCDAPLIYYAKASWYIRTSAFRDRLVALNREINWVPEHVRDGRFGQWLEGNVDWALGRNRYWGTPLPIWQSDAPGSTYAECVGSVAELEGKVGRSLRDLDLHRPYVDALVWDAPDGGTMRRVPEVADCWFDSGSMPLAQWHYPFENGELWAQQQQADFVSEAVDQTRGWFYTLHAVSTLLFDRPAFKNVICLGHILDEDGRKMSKSRGTAVDPWDVFKQHGVDATRWHLYTSGPPGNSRRFHVDMVDAVRGFLNTLWNTYRFWVTYANLSAWAPRLEGGAPAPPKDLLDRWLLSELNRLVRDVTRALESYDVTGATRPVAGFVDGLSNWYARLSRRRIWEDDPDALGTMYHCLVTLSHLLAPMMPYLAEEMYQNLVRGVDARARVADSVHLSRWPVVDEALIDEALSADMALARRVTSLGHAARQLAGLKVRQPLARVVIRTMQPEEREVLARLQVYVLDELNVKALAFVDAPDDLVHVEVHPLSKRLGPRLRDRFPPLRQALSEMDQAALAARFRAGETVTVEVEGQAHPVGPEDVELRTCPREGYSVAEDGGYVVAVTTELTPELLAEGRARDLVRQVQQLRKDAGLAVSDRIVTYLGDVPPVRSVLERFGDYLRSETLTVDLRVVPVGQWDRVVDGLSSIAFELDGQEVRVALEAVAD